MAADRLDLDAEFRSILGNDNVYWQPPANIHLAYPCIVYEENTKELEFADNKIYRNLRSWSVTLIRDGINRDETSKLVDEMLERFEYIRPSNHFVSDNLIHDVYKLYY